jgi:hypothetical protein
MATKVSLLAVVPFAVMVTKVSLLAVVPFAV